MIVEVNGIKLHYTVEGGAGAPWVTFVTGMANDTTLWDGQAAALAGEFQILRFDLPGHGGSDAPGGDYRFADLVSNVVALWDALGIEKSSLVGLGLGGSIALAVGIRHGERLIKLVACCCRAEMTEKFAAIWPGMIETVKKLGMKGMVEPTVERWFTEDFRANNPEMMDKVRKMIRRTNPLGYYGCIAAFLTIDFLDQISEIKTPTLFVSGAEDHLGGPPELMQGLADQVPGSRHVSISDAAHICNLQNEAGYNQVLVDFLRG